MSHGVFITDGHWRKSLAAVRALGKKRVRVTVGESTRLATAFFSRYCDRAVVYPSPFRRPSAFVDFLFEELSRHPYRMLLPMEDETLDLISKHHSGLSRWTYLPIVSSDKLKTARSKDKVLQIAEKLGIPIPKTWFLEDISRLDHLRKGLSYPVVVKPKTGSGALGLSFVENAQELTEKYLAVHKRFPYPLIQERIPQEGPGYGVSLLIDEGGELKASFVHKRLREYPVSGGASTLRESEA